MAKTGEDKKKKGLFSKIKSAFGTSGKEPTPTKPREDDRSSTLGIGTAATRTRSRRSIFGASREQREAERELEERKSRCLAIQAAKRDPPAVQRLLVDCEFCNPPHTYGHRITIENRGLTSLNTADSLDEMMRLQREGVDLSDERTWNVGLDEWLRQRQHWLEPTNEQQPMHFLDSDLTPDRYYTVFDKMIYQTRPLKQPLNLQDLNKIIKAGWVAEGTWPGGSQDAWTDTEDEVATKNDIYRNESSKSSYGSATTSANTTLNSRTHLTNSSINGNSHPSGNGSTTGGFGGPDFVASNSANATAHMTQFGDSGPGKGTGPSQPGSGAATPARSVSGVSLPGPQEDYASVPRIHVQFSDRPHPRADLTPVVSNGMPPLERVHSELGVPLRPIRSSQSSIISLTDSD